MFFWRYPRWQFLLRWSTTPYFQPTGHFVLLYSVLGKCSPIGALIIYSIHGLLLNSGRARRLFSPAAARFPSVGRLLLYPFRGCSPFESGGCSHSAST
jgi:hypothetical protein